MPFVKGDRTSGNPSGMSKAQWRARELSQRLSEEHIKESIDTLLEVMRDVMAQPGARVSAACAMLERSAGKPVAPVEHSGGVEHRYVIETPTVTVDVTEWKQQHGAMKLLQ